MGDGGEEFVLQAVAVGQFQVELLQLGAAFLEDARAFFAHRVDAVGQRQRQQPDLQRRADLAGVHGEEHIGQEAQHHQGVHRAAEEEGAPGEDEVARHAHATQPGDHPGGEDRHGEHQRQRSRQAQGHAVAGAQRQQHGQRADRHQDQQQAIDPRAVLAGVEELAGELAAEQAGRADQEGRRGVRPPGAVRPEVFDAGAIHGHLVEAERGDIEDVVEVAGVAHAEEDEQVVHQHRQQHAVDHAEHVDAPGLLFQVGARRPQGQRRLDRALAFQAQVDALGLVRLHADAEQVVVLLHRAAGERQGVAGALVEAVATLAVRQVEVELVQRRVGQLQQAGGSAVVLLRAVFQVQAQPEHRARIAGVEHVLLMPVEAAFQRGRGDLADVGVAAHVLEHVDGAAERQALDVLVEGHGVRQRRKDAQEKSQPVPHVAARSPRNVEPANSSTAINRPAPGGGRRRPPPTAGRSAGTARP
ncbi:hypothetical protein D3C76_697470 [compost metagenome]